MKMRELLDIVNEASTVSVRDDHGVKILAIVNPTARELETRLKRSNYGELRGYLHDGNVYFWDGMIHEIFAKYIDFDFDEENSFYLDRDEGKIRLSKAHVSDETMEFTPYVLNQPYIQKWFTPNESNTELYLKSSITEAATMKVNDRRGENTLLYINPNRIELSQLVRRSPYNELRGIYSDKTGNFYFWDNEEAFHDTVAYQIDDIFRKINALYVGFTDEYDNAEEGLIKLSSPLGSDSFPHKIANHPYIQKLFTVSYDDPEILLLR